MWSSKQIQAYSVFQEQSKTIKVEINGIWIILCFTQSQIFLFKIKFVEDKTVKKFNSFNFSKNLALSLKGLKKLLKKDSHQQRKKLQLSNFPTQETHQEYIH